MQYSASRQALNVVLLYSTELSGSTWNAGTLTCSSTGDRTALEFLGEGDMLLHGFDMLHGVDVPQGQRYSLV